MTMVEKNQPSTGGQEGAWPLQAETPCSMGDRVWSFWSNAARGIHTVVDTSAYADEEAFERTQGD